MTNVGLILLAAGGSKRLGTPKQLLRDSAGRSLIRRAVETALDSVCRPVIVVLGAGAEAVEQELSGLSVTVVINRAWETGLASSLKAGLNILREDIRVEAGLIMLCDQPQVTAALLNALVVAYEASETGIAASEYAGMPGVPAIFGRVLFERLMVLNGDQGARRVIRAYEGVCARVPFPGGRQDIDTPEDAQVLAIGSILSMTTD